MKIEKLTCPYCGAAVKIKPGVRMTRCEYCDSALVIEDEADHNVKDPDSAEDIGYRFEKGWQRAREEQNRVVRPDTTGGMSGNHLAGAAQYDHRSYRSVKPLRKKHTLWWVLGWIFIFPVPATILCVRSRKLSNLWKIAIIALCWLIYIGIGASGSEESSGSEQESLKSTGTGSAAVQEEKTDSGPVQTDPLEDEVTLYDVPEGFTDGYEKADFDRFNSYASENGLGDTQIWIEGTIEELGSTTVSSNGSDSVFYYYIIRQSDNNKWIAVSGIDGYISREELEARTGDTIVLNGLYQGFSDKFKMPSVNGTVIFDRSKGDRFSPCIYSPSDGTYEFADCFFTVPDGWLFKKHNNNTRYFYPENGMLMVMRLEQKNGISEREWKNETLQDSFFEGYKESFKEIESWEKESTEVDGTYGVIYRLSGTLDADGASPGQVITVVFPTKNSLTGFSFMEFDYDGTYMEDFDKVIQSIRITNRADS